MGEQYQRWVAHLGEGDAAAFPEVRRTLGDLLHPARPGRPTHVINAVSQAVSMDVAPWRWERTLSFYGGLEQQQDPQ